MQLLLQLSIYFKRFMLTLALFQSKSSTSIPMSQVFRYRKGLAVKRVFWQWEPILVNQLLLLQRKEKKFRDLRGIRISTAEEEGKGVVQNLSQARGQCHIQNFKQLRWNKALWLIMLNEVTWFGKCNQRAISAAGSNPIEKITFINLHFAAFKAFWLASSKIFNQSKILKST